MRLVSRFLTMLVLLSPITAAAQQITAADQPAQLDVRPAGARSIRVTLKPISFRANYPARHAVVDLPYAAGLSLREVTQPVKRKIGNLTVEVRRNPVTPVAGGAARSNPVTLIVTGVNGQPVQQLVFENDGNLSFKVGDAPVLGMGEGGPRPTRGTPWREQPVQYDRRMQLDSMIPRWQSDMYGSRNPVAMLLGTDGWGLFVPSPWVLVDMTQSGRGSFIPWKPSAADTAPQNERNQQQNGAKGIPPIEGIVPGLYDFFVFDASDPALALKDYAAITGPAVLP